MINLKSFAEKMFIPGTVPCMLFGALLGIIFAVLCLTIGVWRSLLIGIFCLAGAFIGGVKDKKAFVLKMITFFRKDDSDY